MPSQLSVEELSCDGVAPTGPVCPWPKPEGFGAETRRTVHTKQSTVFQERVQHDTIVKASVSDMAKGIFKTAGAAITHGRVAKEIRDERYSICKECPHFIQDSKRCSECGCFMEAKTWVNAKPEVLCPKNKWER